MEGRVPTFLVDVPPQPAREVAPRLAGAGCGAWSHEHYYCLGLADRVEPAEALRLGLIHYNTSGEVDRLLDVLDPIAA